MSKRAVEQILMRVVSDAEFRTQLQHNPDGALGRFELTDAERTAILDADVNALLDFGVDKRLVQMLPPGIYKS